MTMGLCIEAFNEYDKICAIYGFMMFTPISTIDNIRTRIMTLDKWGRAWDFLNKLTKLFVIMALVCTMSLLIVDS